MWQKESNVKSSSFLQIKILSWQRNWWMSQANQFSPNQRITSFVSIVLILSLSWIGILATSAVISNVGKYDNECPQQLSGRLAPEEFSKMINRINSALKRSMASQVCFSIYQRPFIGIIATMARCRICPLRLQCWMFFPPCCLVSAYFSTMIVFEN